MYIYLHFSEENELKGEDSDEYDVFFMLFSFYIKKFGSYRASKSKVRVALKF